MGLRTQETGRWRRLAAGVGLVGLVVTAVNAAGAGATTLAAPAAVTAHPGSAGSPRAGSSGPSRMVVPGRTTLPAGATAVRAVAPARQLAGIVALQPRHAAALGAFAKAVSTPGNPSYGRYLAPSAFAARFGPTAATRAAVVGQLVGDGLRVTSVSPDGLLVHFRASAGQAGSAFGTHLETYRLRSGRQVFSPASALSLPARIAGSVQAVVGLDDLSRRHPSGLRHGGLGHPAAQAPKAAAHAAKGSPVACPSATSAATSLGGLTDTQIADAYGVQGLWADGDTGQGQTIAVLELEPFARSDIATFDSCYFGTQAASAMAKRLTVTSIDGGQQVGGGSGEAALDIEDISAVAPGADIHVYEAPNTNPAYLDEISAMVSNPAVNVISTSWGECETLAETSPAMLAVENTLFEQAAASGKTVFAAAGDSGTDDCVETTTPAQPYLAVDDPASQPYVTAAGGLTITDASRPPTEEVWNDGPAGGAGGGGISSVWAQPSWQAQSKVPGVHDTAVLDAAAKETGASPGTAFCQANSFYADVSTGCREVPDVSAQADEYTGAVTVYFPPYGWTTFGGTSSAAPLWAAMLADVNASPACHDNPSTAAGVGFASPALYAIASVPAEYQASFTDVRAGNNDAYGVTDGLYPATTGYDMASGLGSPELVLPGGGHGLSWYLCSAAAPHAPTITGVSPSVVSAPDTNVTVTGTGFESTTGTDLVAGVQIGSVGVPTSEVDVESATQILITILGSQPFGGVDAQGNYLTDGNGTYDLAVTLTGGDTSTVNRAAEVTLDYGAAGQAGTPGVPEIEAVAPSGGPQAGGTPVNLYGSGFTGATQVTFGGVAGTDLTVISDSHLQVDPPAYAAGTTNCHAGDTPSTDACQADVQVTNGTGTSVVGRILPSYAGTFRTDADGVPVLPAGCDCETAAAPTEYDYLPRPTVTSVTTADVAADGHSYASEHGGTVATLTGTGLGLLGLEWVDAGPPNLDTSPDTTYRYVSPTKLEVVLPAEPTSTAVTAVKLAVQTLASPNVADLSSTTEPSTTATVDYAPVPSITALSAGSSGPAGPSTGGTDVSLHGTGFLAVSSVTFTDQTGGPSGGRQLALDVSGDRSLSFTTPAELPGLDAVAVCDVTGCSRVQASVDTFIFYPPGNPRVTGVRSGSGSAAGGQKVTVTGANLGFAQTVHFGTKTARIVPQPALLDAGDTTAVDVIVPPGKAGTTVKVRVETVESLATGFGFSRVTTTSVYRYR